MKLRTLALATTATFALSAIAFAQNPRGTAETNLSGKNVSVEYGRPSLKGRDMLSQAPVGTVWRTGADQSTTFTTETDLTAGGTAIPAGSYSLWTKRTSEDGWSLVLNKQTGQWGTMHDASQDLYSVPMKWSRVDSGPDEFTIELSSSGSNGELRLLWGKNVLALPFTAK
jgi:hypothetical protein